jgi:hypothetical protein
VENERTKLVIFGTETFRVLGDSAKEWLKKIGKLTKLDEDDEPKKYKDLLNIRISALLHRFRAQFYEWIYKDSLVEKPINPLKKNMIRVKPRY